MRRIELIHPGVVCAWLAAVLLLTMCTLQPMLLVISVVAAAISVALWCGAAALGRSLRMLVPVAGAVIALNFLFNHRGMTELFRLFARPFTLQALTYGACMALMLTALVLWFQLWQRVLGPDRFLFLFGRAAPTTALLLTSVLRWIPLMQQRWRQMQLAQRALCPDCAVVNTNAGRYVPPSARRPGRLSQLRAILNRVSALAGWSLESSMQAADSMRARGYGQTRRRGSYRAYRFGAVDACCLALLVLCVAAAIPAVAVSLRSLHFYPVLRGDVLPLWMLIGPALLSVLPAAMEGACAWRR
ncbi:MAG: energy-coupling factor transporter transmembrane protein EcfT [Actinomycetes bacterium]|jgi:energy-coupling factor transport system permease protein|nr:energy-coupling factor transporter transmembrane protein EcfT [Actinomycetes bacterium]